MKTLKLIFAGSPGIAAPALAALVKSRHSVVSVLTNPDMPGKRGGNLNPTEISLCAGRLNLPVIKSVRIDAETCAAAAKVSADILVSFAYGAFFPKSFLDLFPLGGINCHPSLLPKYRGASPIQAAVLRGDNETGVTIQKLAAKLDTGDIVLQERIALDGRETAGTLSAKAAETGALLIVKALDLIAENAVIAQKQDESQAVFCKKIEKTDGKIDWSLTNNKIDAMIRAYTPWPLCYTNVDGKELLVLEAIPIENGQISFDSASGLPGTVLFYDKTLGILVKTGNGLLALKRLQWKTKKPLSAGDFFNGARDFIGKVLA